MLNGRHGSARGAQFASRAMTLLAASLFAMGCDDDGSPFETQLDRVDSHATRWTATKPPVYTYTLLRHCECLASMAGPVVITVNDATVLSRAYEDGDGALPAELEEHFPSVDGLYDIIRDALEREYVVTVTYNEQTGVPLALWVDPDVDGADDEFGYTVTSPPTPLMLPN